MQAESEATNNNARSLRTLTAAQHIRWNPSSPKVPRNAAISSLLLVARKPSSMFWSRALPRLQWCEDTAHISSPVLQLPAQGERRTTSTYKTCAQASNLYRSSSRQVDVSRKRPQNGLTVSGKTSPTRKLESYDRPLSAGSASKSNANSFSRTPMCCHALPSI